MMATQAIHTYNDAAPACDPHHHNLNNDPDAGAQGVDMAISLT